MSARRGYGTRYRDPGDLPPAAPTPPPERNAPRWLKFLLFLHIVAITIWAIPMAPNEQVTGAARPPVFDVAGWIRLADSKYLRTWTPLGFYLFETGTWQYWDMFSPNPADTDMWLDAQIVYRDGSTKYYLYPRMYLLPIPNKYAQERYRKFCERVSAKDLSFKITWPQFGLRVAYLNDNPSNPPYTVRLYRHALTIVSPGQKQPTEYTREMFYEYAVNQRDLAKMRADP